MTIQAQILELMKALKREIDTSVLLITHDLGVMAETCDRVAVMYAGNVVEQGPVKTVLKRPQHPYTQGLLRTIPNDAAPDQPLFSIRGTVPSLLQPPTGCAFAPRCDRAMAECAHDGAAAVQAGGRPSGRLLPAPGDDSTYPQISQITQSQIRNGSYDAALQKNRSSRASSAVTLSAYSVDS